MKTTQTYAFTKGQKLHLDDIYLIQGLGDGEWWTATDPVDDKHGGDGGEIVTITKDITITVTIKT